MEGRRDVFPECGEEYGRSAGEKQCLCLTLATGARLGVHNRATRHSHSPWALAVSGWAMFLILVHPLTDDPIRNDEPLTLDMMI